MNFYENPEILTFSRVARLHSHIGNVLFPYWETILPTAGTNSWLEGWGIAQQGLVIE